MDENGFGIKYPTMVNAVKPNQTKLINMSSEHENLIYALLFFQFFVLVQL